ncbi:hypothetical protein PHLGIDRAFT_129731, partial [Phlebiopsis gigantea 11061_1 CR5-6]
MSLYAKNPVSLHTLPQELIDSIVDFLVCTCPFERDRRTEARNCSLISKAWVFRCSQYLLRRIYIDATHLSFASILATIKASERLPLFAIEVSIRGLDTETTVATQQWLRELLEVFKVAKRIELSWRDGKSPGRASYRLLKPLSPSASLHLSLLVLEAPTAGTLMQALRAFKSIGTLEINLKKALESPSVWRSRRTYTGRETLEAAVEAGTMSRVYDHLSLSLDIFQPSQLLFAMDILRLLGGDVKSLKFRAHGSIGLNTPSLQIEAFPNIDLLYLAQRTALHSIDLVIGNVLVFRWLHARFMPHLPRELRHLSIWLHPSNRSTLLAEDWSNLSAALERSKRVPTIEVSPLCPELHPSLVRQLR